MTYFFEGFVMGSPVFVFSSLVYVFGRNRLYLNQILAILDDFHAISSFPPTVNKGWRPGPLQKGATSKDLSVMRINKGSPMFQVCHGRGVYLY